jgi:hypothetical protein
MANLPISGLPAGTTVAGTEPFPSVQSPGGTPTTVKILASDIKTYANNAPTFTGQAVFAAGTALLPSITTTGDTNTGVWFPAADTVAISTGGTSRLRVDSSGLVGINTASPGALLEVSGSSSTGVEMRLRSTDTTAAQIRAYVNSLEAGKFAFDSGRNLTIETAGSTRMTITSAGNVGIGIDPVSSAFQIAKAAPVDTGGANGKWLARFRDTTTSAANVGGGVIFQGLKSAAGAVGNFAAIAGLKENGTDGNEDGYLAMSTVSNATGLITERMRITSTGNVGVNTTAPQTVLDVVGTDGNYIQYRTATRTFSFGSLSGLNSIVAGSGTEIRFWVGSERMRIDSAGNVGIGATSPVYPIDVFSAANGIIRLKGGSALNQGAAFFITNANNNSTMVGFGDRARFFGGTPDEAATVFTSSAPLNFDVNGATRAIITSAGLVGINTPSPTAVLDVNSNIIRLRTAKTPASAADTGNAGDICWDSGYVYVCTATNTWKRAAIATW